jgi:hypothetical protein
MVMRPRRRVDSVDHLAEDFVMGKSPAIPDLGALPSQLSALAVVALKPSEAVSCSAQRSNTFDSQRWVDYVSRFTLRNS